MSDEPVISAHAAGKDTNELFIAAARASCEMSIKNTAVGKWLGQALERLEKSEAENQRLREALTNIRTHMEYVAGTGSHLSACWHMATEALKGGDDDE